MQVLGMFIVIGLILLIIYYIESKYECFFVYNKNNIDLIIKNYDLLIEEEDIANINNIKKNIFNLFQDIDIILTSEYDKYKVSNIYFNEIIPLLNKYDKDKFLVLMDNIRKIIDNSNKVSEKITIIKYKFNKLNELYSNDYYENEKENIELLTKEIKDLLLEITDYNNIYNAGIIFLLDSNLKKAYENDNKLVIESLIMTFYNFLKIFTSIESKNKEKIDFPNKIIFENNIDYIKLIQADFIVINNTFDMINIKYKNNEDKNEIIELNNLLYKSIDNISSYNTNYKDKIISIKNTIIMPIIDNELFLSYNNNDEEEIEKNKNKFYDAIYEIKNIIINYYSKYEDNMTKIVDTFI